jgi:hypothetical protein
MLALILVAAALSWPTGPGSVALLSAQPADAALDDALLHAAPDVFEGLAAKDAVKRAEHDASKLGIHCAVDDGACLAKIGVLAQAGVVIAPSVSNGGAILVAFDVETGKELARTEHFAKKDAANALRALKSLAAAPSLPSSSFASSSPPPPAQPATSPPPPTPSTAPSPPASTPAPPSLVSTAAPVASSPSTTTATSPAPSPTASSSTSSPPNASSSASAPPSGEHAGFFGSPLGLTSVIAAGVAGVAGGGALAAELWLGSDTQSKFDTRNTVWNGGRGALVVAAASGIVAVGAGIPALILE